MEQRAYRAPKTGTLPLINLHFDHFGNTLEDNNLIAEYGFRSKECKEAKAAWEARRKEKAMNEMIHLHDDDRFPVSGRDLHMKLDTATEYRHWFPRMCENGFVEKVDFNPVKIERVQPEGSRTVSREVVNHMLTLSMAKELCMLQRTDRGREIRRHLIAVEEQWNSPEAVMARGLQMASKKLVEMQGKVLTLEAQAEEDRPFAAFGRTIENSHGAIYVADFAKLLCNDPGINVGERRMFKWLRDKRFLQRNNRPYQEYIRRGWFEVKVYLHPHYGKTRERFTPLITGKGQIALTQIYLRGLGGVVARQVPMDPADYPPM